MERWALALKATRALDALIMAADHDAYIAEAPEDLRPLLAGLRAQLVRALPDAEEVIAYKMPGFRIGKSIVAGYGKWSAQVSFFTKGLASRNSPVMRSST